ncbi:HAD family phosphatase [Streptomyces pathocidini]|uniref:HAD family hydrolase n=1 Tax=Streptomyces pathocidini TaxID=1650571 RepID=UPI0033F3F500
MSEQAEQRSQDLPAAVLFDMDGTLVDTEILWWRTAERVARGLGHALGEADEPGVIGRSVADTAAHLHAATGGAGTLEEITADLDRRFLAAVESETVPRPGALRLLDLLAYEDVPTALVSASPRSVVDTVLKTLGPERFRVTVAEGETPRTKPAPDPYLAAAQALGADPSACVAVEDSPAGVASAEAAGCRVIAVPSFTPIEVGPGRTILGSLEAVGLPLLSGLSRPRSS